MTQKKWNKIYNIFINKWERNHKIGTVSVKITYAVLEC